MRRSWLAILLTALCVVPGLSRAQEPDAFDIGRMESVEVQLVLLDVAVVDRAGRTVPDLRAEDFDVLVDHKLVDIASLDSYCRQALADPKGGERRPPTVDPDPLAPKRRIVLVFDYHHIVSPWEVRGFAREALEHLSLGDEEHMVISLGDGLTVEQPFTDDVQATLIAIDRMARDPRLRGITAPLTERHWYRKMKRLLDVLELVPGRKVVLLFGGPLHDDGFTHDIDFRQIAAMAARARTAFYPVDTRGVVVWFTGGGGRKNPGSFPKGVFGPPRRLNRLAIESGGRMTSNTNDLALGYARAQRDLSCGYTIGFYDRKPRPDHERRVVIRSTRRPGLRVVHAANYVVRSEREERVSRLRTAIAVPELFRSDRVNLDVFLDRPEGGNLWRVSVAAEVRLDANLAQADASFWELRGAVRKDTGTTIQRFKRRIDPRSLARVSERTGAVVHETVRIKPGRYQLDVVISHPDLEAPLAATREVVIPSIPREELFVVGPRLGRQGEEVLAGHDWLGAVGAIEPLVVPRAERGVPLAVLTSVCRVGSRQRAGATDLVSRRLTDEEDRNVGKLLPGWVVLGGRGNVHCGLLVDWLATDRLAPGRYRLHATRFERVEVPGDGHVEFTVTGRPEPVSDGDSAQRPHSPGR